MAGSALWSRAAGLAGVAARSFAAMLGLFFVLGLLLACASWYFLREKPWYAAIAAAVALAEGTVTGIFLGAKRALVMAVAHGIKSLSLGRRAVSLIFERLLGVDAGQEFGQRGGRMAQAAERIPLAQAQQRLTQAVNELIRVPAEGGSWFRSKMQALILRSVEKYTLARFRQEGAQQGGVDLLKVQAELTEGVEQSLIARLRAGLNLWTIVAILGLPTAVFAQVYIVIALLGR